MQNFVSEKNKVTPKGHRSRQRRLRSNFPESSKYIINPYLSKYGVCSVVIMNERVEHHIISTSCIQQLLQFVYGV